MKDIIITEKRVKTEIKMLISCFVFAMLLNIAAIIIYNTQWKEIYTQFLWILLITGIVYCGTIAARIAYCLIKGALKSN